MSLLKIEWSKALDSQAVHNKAVCCILFIIWGKKTQTDGDNESRAHTGKKSGHV